MKFKLFACEVLCREVCAFVASSPHQVDVEFLPKGLHDLGKKKMKQRIQTALDTVDESQYDFILLGYALCNGGVVGLTAKTIPLVIPKAHDCITFFLGSRKRYEEYFFANSGTYFKTVGWVERGDSLSQMLDIMPFYKKFAFIETGIEPNDSFAKQTETLAAEKEWEYEKLPGDLTLLKRLLHGHWDNDFLIAQPGCTIQFSYDDEIIKSVEI
ncbi:hypothetical protein FACS189454_04920 [Planctomycetales bacterium]|nr:hypothetical protein FACS189454_04920 [Planctomycetales bacterium]